MPGPWKWTFQHKQVNSAPWHLDSNLSRDSKPDLPSKAAPKCTETVHDHKWLSSLNLLHGVSFLRQRQTQAQEFTADLGDSRRPKGGVPVPGLQVTPGKPPTTRGLLEQRPQGRERETERSLRSQCPSLSLSLPIRLMRELGREAQTP